MSPVGTDTYAPTAHEMALLRTIRPVEQTTSTDVVNALFALSCEVQELRAAILTPERRLANLGLFHALTLPAGEPAAEVGAA